MTAVGTATGMSPTLPWQLRRAAVLTWLELPRIVAAGALLVLSSAPLAVAALWAPWWLAAAAALAPALLLTGLAAVAADLARGERMRLRRLTAVDPVLALTLVAAGTAAERMLAAGGSALIAGCVLVALLALLAGPSLAYGAARGRRGLGALRGGAILAIWRPGTALTLLSLGCLGGFAVAATAGVLALVVPAMLSVFAAQVVSAQLAHADAGTGGAAR